MAQKKPAPKKRQKRGVPAPPKSHSKSIPGSLRGFKKVEGVIVGEESKVSAKKLGGDRSRSQNPDEAEDRTQEPDVELSIGEEAEAHTTDLPHHLAPTEEEAISESRIDPEAEPGKFSSALVPAASGSGGLTAGAATDPLARYLAEIGRYSLLTREEEQALAIRYRETGDAKAAERLVTSNLRFVVKIAAEYTKFGARMIDLVQEGNVGLMHAVKEFNPYKGVRLITYAVWWIRGYIQEYLMRQYSMVRIGTTATQRKLFYQLQKQKEELERMGLEQGIAQLSGKLGVPESEVQEMHSRLSGRDISLDAPVGEDGNARLLDLQSEADPHRIDEDLGNREQIRELIRQIDHLRPSLNERELFLLEARLLADEPLTLQEIGDKYGTTREAVRQMESRLIAKIKRALLEHEG